ncbi:TetR family transcriptional regulator C-terminal domain-containing protein [Amycolatopsis sp. NPDC000673]|uniref:TetR family transcriptional regulator C-terminal domain-containing protein n=1 Tax=Amycolatopsis sp. NPDC000673 TaxID=3154267 RepID=UPI003320DECC
MRRDNSSPLAVLGPQSLLFRRRGGRLGPGRHQVATHPRDVLRVTLTEMLPLHPDARATSRMNAAYVLEALHDPELHTKLRDDLREKRALVEHLIRQAIADGHIAADRDPAVETNLVLALTGLTPLLELDVIESRAALMAVDQYLDRLFA